MIRKIAMMGATAVVALGTLATVPAAAAPSGTEAVAGKPCHKGNICFYTGRNFTGDRCSRTDNFPHWGSRRCNTQRFRSYINNGKAGYHDDVRAYTKFNYKGGHVNLRNGAKGNFRAPTPIRSAKWLNF